MGSAASVSVEAAAGTFDVGSGHATDVVARVDGIEITGQGNEIEINTATLKADVEFAQGFTGQVDPITISGGAMTFNFSPDRANQPCSPCRTSAPPPWADPPAG